MIRPTNPKTLADNRRRCSMTPIKWTNPDPRFFSNLGTIADPNTSAVKLAALTAPALTIETMLTAQEQK